MPPSPAEGAAGVDDALRQLVEVADLQVLLGGVDEVRLLGEEPPREAGAQPHAGGGRKLALLDVALLEPLQGIRDLGERHAEALDGGFEEGGFVLLDPALDEGEDLVVPQMLRGEIEGLAGDGRVGCQGGAGQRAVVVQIVIQIGLGLTRRVRRALEKPLGSHQAVPDEVMDHLPAQTAEQGTIDLAQEIEVHPPLGRRCMAGFGVHDDPLTPSPGRGRPGRRG